jgi:predicted MFS family arabinose efflux permease
VMGLPLGLYLSNKWNWHAPFLMIAGIGAVVGLVIIFGLKPIDGHLKLKHDRNAFQHLLKTVSRPMYLRGFAATVLLATGGFMLMPFSSAFTVNNLGISLDHLPTIYFVTGISSIIAGPLLGRLSDSLGKYPIFCFGTMLGIIMVTIYCHLGLTPLWGVILVNILLFIGISARMVSASALISSVPDAPDRGAYMSVNSSVQQFAGGMASGVAGLVVVQTSSGRLEHYDLLGFIVAAAMAATMWLMYSIQKIVKTRMAKPTSPPIPTGAELLPKNDEAIVAE